MAIEHIGPRIREARDAKKISQDVLADIIGAANGGQVSKWERGEVVPETRFFLALADALDVTLDWLAAREIADDPPNLARFFVELVPEMKTPPTPEETAYLRTAFSNHGDPAPEAWMARLISKRRGVGATVKAASEEETSKRQAQGDALGVRRRKPHSGKRSSNG